jgi:hypothetical protein
MKRLWKYFVFLLIAAMVLSACGTPRMYYDPSEPGIDGQVAHTEPQPGTLAKIIQVADKCPVQTDALDNYIMTRFPGHKLPDGSLARICGDFATIQMSTIGVVALLAIPAAIEPTPAGEATVGAIYIGGKAVAWLYIGSAVVITTGVLFGDIIGDAIVDAVLAPIVAADIPAGWNIGNPPQDAIRDLERVDHHAADHALRMCIASVSRKLAPNKVYFSPNAPEKKVTTPSLAFVWYMEKSLKDMAGDLANCANYQSDLDKEYRPATIPSPAEVNLVMVVGKDQRGNWISISAYPVKKVVFEAWLKEWHYIAQLYPTFKPTGY